MKTIVMYAIQCIDPDEPNSWFIFETMYKTEEEAQKTIQIFLDSDERYGKCRHSVSKVIQFAIEVPDHE